MKYNKILIVFCVMLTFFFTKLYGQDTNEIPGEYLLSDKESELLSDAKGAGSENVKSDFQPEQEDIDLEEENNDNEMVNVAFREIYKRNTVGAITVLNPGEFINEDFNTSVSGGINGRISRASWALASPLVMIDGVPRNYNDIKLEEVEQISILKGVNAVALYGSHAANGVILITTKRGVATEERDINVRVNSGIQMPKLFPQYLGSAEYMTLFNEARSNDGMDARYDDETIENYRTGDRYRYPSIDYYSEDHLTDFVYNTDVHADFSGGTEDAQFYANIGYIGNSSLLNVGEGKNEFSNRFNVRGRTDVNLSEFISSSFNMSAILDNARYGHGNYWGEAANRRPHEYSPFLPTNRIASDSTEIVEMAENSMNIIDDQYILGGSQEYMTNPFAELRVGGHNEYVNRILQISNNTDVDLNNVLDGLTFHTMFNADFYNSYNQYIYNEYSIYQPTWRADEDVIVGLEQFGRDARDGVQHIDGTSQTRSLGGSLMFNYETTVNDDHNITALLLGTGNQITINDVVQPNTNTNLGLHLGYNYMNRYLIDFSGAVVNSTKLAEGNRVGFSPTIGLGWLLSSEDFLSGSNVVDHLKLTTQAGIVNTDIYINDYYLYDDIYHIHGWYNWADGESSNQVYSSLHGGNPDLNFAQRKEFNIGVEGAFFDRMLWLESSFYVMQMDGFPTQRYTQYPNFVNEFIPYTNYNSNQYTGVDLRMNVNQNVGDLGVNLGVNMSYATSEALTRDELYAYPYLEREGKPVDAIFGLESDGLFMNEDEIEDHSYQAFGEVLPGDIKYIDQNEDGFVDENDQVQIGRWIAPFNFGINLTLSYNRLTFFVQATGNIGGNGIKSNSYYWMDGNDKYSEIARERWTEETKNTAEYPRLSSVANPNNFRSSDFWIFDTDRLDISRVQVTYDLLRNNAGRNIDELSVYVYGSNLLTLSKNKDIMNLNIGGTPQYRYVNLGIRANF